MRRDLKILTLDILGFCCKNLTVIHNQVSIKNVLQSKSDFCVFSDTDSCAELRF